MKALFFWIFILAGLTGTFSRVLGLLQLSFESCLEEAILSVGLGFGALAYTVFLVGSMGFLTQPVFAVVVAGIFILGMSPFQRVALGVFGEAVLFWKESRLWDRALILLMVAVFGLSLCGALAPAIGQDELCYHLMQPKNYVHAHAIYEVPFSSNSLWPYLMQMLFTLGLLLQGDSLAKLFHFATYLLAGLTIFLFLKREVGSKAALYGMAVYALTPVAFIQASFAYVDNALAFYVFISFYAFYLFLKEKKIGWAILSGIFSGFAASIKLLGLFALPILFLIAIPSFIKSDKKKNFLGATLIFTAALLISGGLWYARSWILRGNPVYPFYPEIFGGHGWGDTTYLSHGGHRNWVNFLLVFWNLTLRPQLFGGEQIGVVYLAILPLLLLQRPWPAWLKSALFFAALYVFFWFKVDPNTRFLMPALPFLACGVAYWMDKGMDASQKKGRLLIGTLLGVMLVAQSAFAIYHFKDAVALLFHKDRAFYLRDKERSFAAAKEINRSLKATDRILSTREMRGYYFENTFVLEGDIWRMTHYADQAHSGRELADYLKAQGFTHVLDADLGEPNSSDPPVTRFLRENPDKKDYFEEILRVHSKEAHYILYKIL